MKRRSTIFLFGLLLSPGVAMASELGFEDTAEGIENKLSAPTEEHVLMFRGGISKQKIETRGLIRVYTLSEEGTLEESPAVVSNEQAEEKKPAVVSDEKAVVERAVAVPAQREAGFVNLAIHFEVDSSHIDSSSAPILNELARALASPALRGKSFSINGHTDSDGSETHNYKLSLNRAISVRQYLSSNHAVDENRLKVVGYGEGLELVPNTTAANKQLNRRVEITAIGD